MYSTLKTLQASLLISAVGLLASPEVASAREDNGAQVMKLCHAMSEYGRTYAELRASGKDSSAAWHGATDTVAKNIGVDDVESLSKVTGAITIFIDAIGKHRPDSTGYFAGAACLSAQGMHKMMPVTSDEGISAINAVLAKCEAESKDDDSLGACIFTGLKPLAQ